MVNGITTSVALQKGKEWPVSCWEGSRNWESFPFNSFSAAGTTVCRDCCGGDVRRTCLLITGGAATSVVLSCSGGQGVNDDVRLCDSYEGKNVMQRG